MRLELSFRFAKLLKTSVILSCSSNLDFFLWPFVTSPIDNSILLNLAIHSASYESFAVKIDLCSYREH
jgi:hypothetical protein